MLTQRLRHRVTVQHSLNLRNPTTGSVTTTWHTFWCDSNTPVENWPAEVLTGPGREPFASDAKQSETDARIVLRWFPGLTQAMRILFDGEQFDIQSIEKDRTGRREYRLRCTIGVGDGS